MKEQKGFKLYGTTMGIMLQMMNEGMITESDYCKVMRGAMRKVFYDEDTSFEGDKEIMKTLYDRLLEDNPPKKIDRRSITSKENGKKGGRPRKNIVG